MNSKKILLFFLTALIFAVSVNANSEIDSLSGWKKEDTTAKEKSENNNNTFSIFREKKQQAHILFQQGRYRQALAALDRIKPLIKKDFPLAFLRDYYYEYVKNWKKLGNYEKAMEYYKKYVQLKDSVFSMESDEKISNFQVKYETEKKEQQLRLKNTRIKVQRVWLYVTIGGIALLLMFSVIILQLFLQKTRANKELVRKILELVKTEKEIARTGAGSHREAEERAAGTRLTEENKQALIKTIQNIMEKEKIYLKEDISLNKLAIRLKTNSTYLSMVINDHFDQSFTDFLNQYRVKEARRILSEKESRKYTMEYIARQVGFSSRSTFNRAFKKYTGITPSFFLRSLEENGLKEELE